MEMLAGSNGWLFGIIASVVAIIGSWFAGRRSGAKGEADDAALRQAERDLQQAEAIRLAVQERCDAEDAIPGCLTTVLLTGCVTAGPAIDAGCLWTAPIYVSRVDVLTDGTARQILMHNEAKAAACRLSMVWIESGRNAAWCA